jgi:hypothetical protein
MKAILTSLVAMSLVAGLAGHADAATHKKKRLQANHHSKSYRTTTRQPASNGSSDYYEHLLDKVPFGSQRWWSIYDEQHGTPF